jgi:kynurenine formamidase
MFFHQFKRKKITISKKPVDISHTISQDMPIFPGNPTPKFESVLRLEEDGANVTRVSMGTHTGTHVDSESHFFKYGKGIDNQPVSKFVGEALVIDLSRKNIGDGIKDIDLNHYRSVVRSDDIILLYTGVSNFWRQDSINKVATKFTYLEPSAAEWLVYHNIKSVGIDSPSVEKYGSIEGLTHKKLLSAGIGIVENLSSNLKKFVDKRVFLVCLPLSLKGLDAAPARAVIFDI